MPSGDRSRTWFPELVTDLRRSWQPESSWDAIIALRTRLQATLAEILLSRGITPARYRCFHCGHVGPAAPPVITVRAMLLALKRFGIESEDAVRKLDKAWAKHRTMHQLDMHGHRAEPRAPALHPHEHAREET